MADHMVDAATRAKMTTRWTKTDKLKYRSLFLFNKDNKFRLLLYNISTSQIFDFIILLAIIGSCILLTKQRQQQYSLTDKLILIDLILNLLFAFEALMKIVSHGFVLHRHAYLRDPWNIFDFIVVLAGGLWDIAAVTTDGKSFSLKALRLFRVFRPLRLIVKSNNLKVVLDTIIKSFNVLFHVLMFILLLIFLYAITGMELFGDTVYTACVYNGTGQLCDPFLLCDFGDTTFCPERFGLNASCMEYPSKGVEYSHFQNIFSSMLTVLQCITMEDWVLVAYDVAFYNSHYATWIYFISLIWIGGYFAIDLLMGVLGNQYLRTKECAIIAMEKRKERERAERLLEEPKKPLCNLWKVLKPRLNRLGERISRQAAKLQTKFKPINDHMAFFYLVNLVVLADVLGSTYYGQNRPDALPSQLPTTYMGLKFGLFMFYVFENMIEGFSLGLHKVKKSPYFMMSAGITITAGIELFLAITGWTNEVFVGISFIRAVTLVELFKLTRWWERLKMIINSLFETLKGVIYLFVLLFIVLANYALLGNQFFGDPEKNLPTTSGTFDSFGSSLLLTFVMLTGDNWTGIMFDTVELMNAPWEKVLTVLYFISFVVIGNFILMNVFLGIIVDNLTNDFEEKQTEQANKERRKKQKMLISQVFKAKTHLMQKWKSSHENNGSEEENTENKNEPKKDPNPTNTKNNKSSRLSEALKLVRKPVDPKVKDVAFFIDNTLKNTLVHFDDGTTSSFKSDGSFMSTKSTIQVTAKTSKLSNALGDGYGQGEDRDYRNSSSDDGDSEEEDENPHTQIEDIHDMIRMSSRRRAYSLRLNPEINCPIPHHKALFLFKHTNEFRRHVFWLVTSSKFTYAVCAAIVISCGLMALDDPLNRDPEMTLWLNRIDYVFSAVFLIEVILKSIAYGFVMGHKNCYLRSYMNIIDFVAVFFSLFNIFITLVGDSEHLQFKTIRIIRVVRMLKISTDLKRVINCLVNSLQRITYFLVLYVLILFIYAVIGVHLYHHALHVPSPIDLVNASSNAPYSMEDSHGFISSSPEMSWEGVKLSFNNFGHGMMTLFVASTLDDWFLVLTRLTTAGHSEVTGIVFLLSFLILMSFILMNVFIGFVVVLFHKEKEKDEQYNVLNTSGQECLVTALSANPTQLYDQPHGRFKIIFWRLASHPWFQKLSMIMILMNTGFMMTKHTRQDEVFFQIQRLSNIVFTSLFTIEIAIKLTAFSMKALLRDRWLLFDAIVILGSWFDIVLEELQIPFLKLSIFRLFRVARLAQVLGKGGNLRQLFATFLKSMKCVPSIACLMGLILYFYAILGMNLFGRLKIDDTTAINSNANFQSFTAAILVLIRVTTLDQWQGIMLTCADTHLMNCANGSNENCGTTISYFYFGSFVFICSYIMTNLFLAFIMDNFVYLTHDWSELDSRHIHLFTAIWGQYDKSGAGFIKKEKLVSLLKNLNPPLGNGKMCPDRTIYARILKLRVPVEKDGTVRFNELLMTLVLDFLQLKVDNVILREDIHKLFPIINDDLLDRVLPLSYDPRIINETEKEFYQDCASYVITGYCRLYKSSLTAAFKIKDNANSSKEVQNISRGKFASLVSRSARDVPSIEITEPRGSKSLTNLDLERGDLVLKIKVAERSRTW